MLVEVVGGECEKFRWEVVRDHIWIEEKDNKQIGLR